VKAVAAGGRGTSEALNDREQLLMTQVAGGDGAAFAELFDGHSPIVLGFLVRLLRHRGLAEEVLQETFLQAWLQAGNYRPELGTPRGWILLIARSRALDCLRRETSRNRREEALSQNGPRRMDPVGTERLEEIERQERVRDGLARLPEAQQACLALAFNEDLSHAEIARRLSTPLGTVKSRVRLGMRKLGGMLGLQPA
jgi:RNA polymerase sigma-70 factor (ECF subfamily)